MRYAPTSSPHDRRRDCRARHLLPLLHRHGATRARGSRTTRSPRSGLSKVVQSVAEFAIKSKEQKLTFKIDKMIKWLKSNV